MDTSTAAAPAQPDATPKVQTAAEAAIGGRSTSNYREARRAERAGKPLPSVPVESAKPAAAAAQPAADDDGDEPVAPAAAAQPERKVSKRQEQINDYERRIAAQDERIRALEAGGKPAAEAAPAAPPKDTAEWKRYAAMADAPKLEDFESLTDHNAAMSLFIAKTMLAEDRQAGQQRAHDEQRGQFLKERGEKFGAHLKKASEADPDFISKIPPAVVNATPLSGCRVDARTRALIDPRSGKPVTFSNVAAEAAFRSENPAALLLHLNAHSEDVQRIAQLPQDEWMDALARLDGRLNAGAASVVAEPEPEPEPKTISDAPEPPATVGSRPASPTDPETVALAQTKRGGTRAYRELRRQQRANGMGR